MCSTSHGGSGGSFSVSPETQELEQGLVESKSSCLGIFFMGGWGAGICEVI